MEQLVIHDILCDTVGYNHFTMSKRNDFFLNKKAFFNWFSIFQTNLDLIHGNGIIIVQLKQLICSFWPSGHQKYFKCRCSVRP